MAMDCWRGSLSTHLVKWLPSSSVTIFLCSSSMHYLCSRSLAPPSQEQSSPNYTISLLKHDLFHFTVSLSKHSSSTLFCSHLLSPVYQSFTPLVNALWQLTILLKPVLPKLPLPSLLLTSLDIFSPWPDWHNRNLLITLHFRSLASHIIYLLSLLRPFLLSTLYSLSFLYHINAVLYHRSQFFTFL